MSYFLSNCWCFVTCISSEILTKTILLYSHHPFPTLSLPYFLSGAHQSYLSVDRKFLDLFLSIHGDFFLLNPRSSFSWQVYVVRVCLGTLMIVIDYGSFYINYSLFDYINYALDTLIYIVT